MSNALSSDVAAGVPDSTPEAGARPATRRAGRRRLQSIGQKYGTIAILVLLAGYFAVKTDGNTFLSPANLSSILQSSAVLAMVAAGLTLVLVIGAFDLSIVGNMVLSVLLAAQVAVTTGNTAIGFAAAVGVAGLVGLLNGLIVTKLNVPPFIATLAMGLFILVGFQQKVSPEGTVSFGLPSGFGILGQGSVFGVRYAVLIALGLLIVLHVVLRHTVLGRQMYAIGSSPEAARLAGIRVDLTKIIAFVVCGLCCGLAGFMTASIFGLGSAQAGGSILLDAFTACFIGASTLVVGRFHIIGTAIGVLTLGMLTNGLTLTGWTSDDVPIAKGVILIVAVAAAGLMKRRA